MDGLELSRLNSAVMRQNEDFIIESLLNEKDDMFTYQTPISHKKWFLTLREELVDLNSFTAIRIQENGNVESKNKFLVASDTFDLLGEFETVQDAKEYIKKVHLFLVGQ